MTDNTNYADIILLALIAGFILLRLRGVLGHDAGGDSANFFKKSERQAAMSLEPVVEVNEKSQRPKPKEEPDTLLERVTNNAVTDTIISIKAKDPQFSYTTFINGAKLAYEMVFDAYEKADKATLKMLLSDARYKEFEEAIEARSKETHTETTLVSVKANEVIHAELSGNVARLTVSFGCEQVTVTRDKDGKIIEGNPSEIHHTDNEWTFERDVTSKNPNWKIIET